LLSLHQNVDRLRAERLLDAAQAATVPHLEKDGRKSFYQSLHARTRRAVVADVAPSRTGAGTRGGPSLFTVDGAPVDKRGLVAWLAQTFGGSAMNRRAS
jgi:hypothetical protein